MSMPQAVPVAEKDVFLKAYEREFHTTMRVLSAYPKDKLDLTADNLRSARDIATLFVGEQAVADMAMNGNIDFSAEPSPPASMDDIITMFETLFRRNIDRVRSLSENAYNSTVMFPTGPGTGAQLRTADVLWLTLYDMVHHRGQLSVYLRLAGGKVPSIYGPSADEMEQVFLI
jgi:uncharacterized damage-inducible protein DinB